MNHWPSQLISAKVSLPPKAGQPRNPAVTLVALEYLLWPKPRPHGLQKQLAHANGILPNNLSRAVKEIQLAAVS